MSNNGSEDTPLLSDRELEVLFEEIKNGERCIQVNGRTFIFKYPTKEDLDYCTRLEHIYVIKFKDDIPDSNKIRQFMSKDVIHSLSIDDLKREENKFKLVLEKDEIKRNPEGFRYYTIELVRVQRRIEELEGIEKRIDKAERFCIDSKIRDMIWTFLVQKCTFIMEDGKLVSFFDQLLLHEKYKWIGILLPVFLLFYYGPPDRTSRQLARHHKISNLWKISCSTGVPFFHGASTDYSPVQIKICFWLGYYVDVFKNLGSPDNKNITEDDKLFDAWVESRVNELKSDSSDKGGSSKSGSDTRKHKIVFKNPIKAT